MRKIILRRLIQSLAVVIACVTSIAISAEDRVLTSLQSIGDTRHFELSSEIVGRNFQILVRLPDSYDENESSSYPTLYLLDGGVTYAPLAGYYWYLRLQESIPEMIIVAISYGASDFRDGNFRSTDYTAPSAERDHYGGASKFQEMLTDELLPRIETDYRSDPERRLIFGQSIAGQFVIYTAMTEPNLFWGYISSNAALHRNLDFFLQTHSDIKSDSRLFVGGASNDDELFQTPRAEWIEYWGSQAELPWVMETRTISGYGHFSVLTESFRQGLEWIFAD